MRKDQRGGEGVQESKNNRGEYADPNPVGGDLDSLQSKEHSHGWSMAEGE
jgi:hypothetical protein